MQLIIVILMSVTTATKATLRVSYPLTYSPVVVFSFSKQPPTARVKGVAAGRKQPASASAVTFADRAQVGERNRIGRLEEHRSSAVSRAGTSDVSHRRQLVAVCDILTARRVRRYTWPAPECLCTLVAIGMLSLLLIQGGHSGNSISTLPEDHYEHK